MRQFKLPRPLALSAFALVAAFMAGCSETNPPTGLPSLLVSDNPDVHACENENVEFSKFKLAKVGGTGTFQVVVTHEESGNVLDQFNVTLEDGECAVVHENNTNLASNVTRVTVTETSGNFLYVDLTLIDSRTGITHFPGLTDPTVTSVVSSLKSGMAKYFNEEDGNGGGAGCTPGFWRQEQHFAYWTAPYTPGTLFGAVFDDAFPGKTLLDVVWLGGGGLNALGRHTVAALLNAASPEVDYGMTPQEVIDAFNAAFASGDYETQKDAFEGLNEQGCTVDKSK
jgi:hypothetical protein